MSAFINTWYGTILLFAAVILVYLSIGAYISGRICDKEGSTDEYGITMVTLLWPLGSVALLCFGIYLVLHKPFELGESYTARKDKRKGIEAPIKGKPVRGGPYDYAVYTAGHYEEEEVR